MGTRRPGTRPEHHNSGGGRRSRVLVCFCLVRTGKEYLSRGMRVQVQQLNNGPPPSQRNTHGTHTLRTQNTRHRSQSTHTAQSTSDPVKIRES